VQEVDRVIAEAGRFGVRLIIPIVSNFDSEDTNWVGGWMDLIRLKKGYGSNEEAKRSGVDWWTDHEMLESFKLIIDKLTSRVNHLTGTRYADDPAILAWETGELPLTSPRNVVAESLTDPRLGLLQETRCVSMVCVQPPLLGP